VIQALAWWRVLRLEQQSLKRKKPQLFLI
jgi:hypothetical protein